MLIRRDFAPDLVIEKEHAVLIDHRRVLIIDEDRRTVDKLHEAFVRSGYEAEIALSGHVGSAIVTERRMSVAVLSAKMGHEKDWTLLKALKKCDPDLPVILFDAPKVKGLSREARRAGAAKFLPSPIDAKAVLAAALKVSRN